VSATDWRAPVRVREHLGHVIADTVGVSIAGHQSEQMCALLAGTDPLGGLLIGQSAGATVLSPGAGHATPELAAYLNATAGSFLELDEGMRPTGHPGMQVVTAALAVAETVHASGEELERAVLAGYEVAARLFQAFRLRYPVHPHGHFGAVGAAVSVALLTATDPVEAAAVAAATPLLTTWNPCFEGATARNTWMGLAAQSGIRATRLVRAGFTGSREAMDVAFGEIAGELVYPEVLTAPLDHDHLGVTRNYFKIHSACALTHAAIEAVLASTMPPVQEITRIRIETIQNNLKLDRQARPNALSTRFSLPYAVATAVITGRSDPSAFQYNEEVGRLAERVEVSFASDLESRWPAAAPARVVVEWSGGEVRSEVVNPYGSHAMPLTEQDLKGKFRANVGPSADALWERLTGLAGENDCGALFGLWR
jgi:2-methylcitrate dehydratase PrpD